MVKSVEMAASSVLIASVALAAPLLCATVEQHQGEGLVQTASAVKLQARMKRARQAGEVPTTAALADALFNSYNTPRNAFPAWAKSEVFLRDFAPAYNDSVLTFHAAEDDQAEVRKLLVQREPTNLAMTRHHNVERFHEVTQRVVDASEGNLAPGPWSTSYYSTFFEAHGNLAPNIAIYAETPLVEYDASNGKADFYAADDALKVRVMNVVGYGFDYPTDENGVPIGGGHSTQPDALFFGDRPLNVQASVNDPNGALLSGSIKKIFDKILACLRHFNQPGAESSKNIEWIHVPGFGTGAFGGYRVNEVTDMWREHFATFKRALENDEDFPLNQLVQVLGMDDHIYPSPNQEYYSNVMQLAPTMRGYADNSALYDGLGKRLFVNAWDPHSIVGNANFEDASLDGYYGRSTAMALLCWPPTNPGMLNADRLIKVDGSGNPLPAAALAPTPPAPAPGAPSAAPAAAGDYDCDSRRIAAGVAESLRLAEAGRQEDDAQLAAGIAESLRLAEAGRQLAEAPASAAQPPIDLSVDEVGATHIVWFSINPSDGVVQYNTAPHAQLLEDEYQRVKNATIAESGFVDLQLTPNVMKRVTVYAKTAEEVESGRDHEEHIQGAIPLTRDTGLQRSVRRLEVSAAEMSSGKEYQTKYFAGYDARLSAQASILRLSADELESHAIAIGSSSLY